MRNRAVKERKNRKKPLFSFLSSDLAEKRRHGNPYNSVIVLSFCGFIMLKIKNFLLSLCTIFVGFMSSAVTAAPTSDIAYVQEKGNLIVGITEFAPMDFRDKKGNWVGFDADVARAFAKYLGVKCEFQLIDWDNKVLELKSKTIDVVWNGMTLTDEVKSAMSVSNAYCNNAQIVVVPLSKADSTKTVESLKPLTFAVETGSAGQRVAKENGLQFIECADQATAVLEVKSGNADGAIIDSLMAAAMVGPGTSYSNLTYTVKLNSEEYGVGFRKGSNMPEKLNEFFKLLYADGTLQKIANQYRVQAALIEQK